MKRRTFIKGAAAGIGLAIATGLYTWQVEPFWLDVVHVDMPIAGLPEQAKGKTVMQISDIHVGDKFDYHFLIESFNEVRDLAPDIVVYTGDFLDHLSFMDKFQEVLKYFVKGKEATLAVLGNHDYGRNWAEPQVAQKISNVLEQHGVQVLRNEKTQVLGIDILGIDDYWGTNFNPSQVMKAHNPSSPSILLCHNPDACDQPIWNGYQGWILSGHTHGGQCKPPFLPPPVLPVKNKKYTSGKFDLNDGRTLYINRALGHLWQVRFNVRPEITLFRLG